MKQLRLTLMALVTALSLGAAIAADVLFIHLADTHSAYDAYPRFLTQVREVLEANEGTPAVILFNGDLFELGNVVSARSEGEADWAFLRALGELAPVVMNIGNHEFDFMSPAEFVEEATAAGVTLIGNIFDRESGNLLVPASTQLEVGERTVTVLGVATNALNTYVPASRPLIALPNPAAWVEATFPVLAGGDLTVLLTHAGVSADRRMFETLPAGTLVVGGHDHLVIQEEVNGSPYLHTGFRLERLTVTLVEFAEDGTPAFRFENYTVDATVEADTELADLIASLREEHLQEADLATVGTVDRDYTVREAVDWALETLREATGADVVMLNHTSFGSGLAAGELPRYRFDEFIRFDNDVMRTTVDGETLQAIMQRANQSPDTPLAERTGDFIYASDIDPQAGETYTLVVSSWIALPMNVMNYLGTDALTFEQIEGVTTKGILAAALEE